MTVFLIMRLSGELLFESIGEALRVQCLYVLNNMSHWRGEIAKAVRQTLKTFTT